MKQQPRVFLPFINNPLEGGSGVSPSVDNELVEENAGVFVNLSFNSPDDDNGFVLIQETA